MFSVYLTADRSCQMFYLNNKRESLVVLNYLCKKQFWEQCKSDLSFLDFCDFLAFVLFHFPLLQPTLQGYIYQTSSIWSWEIVPYCFGYKYCQQIRHLLKKYPGVIVYQSPTNSCHINKQFPERTNNGSFE